VTRVHVRPFQCRASEADPAEPTAQALLAEVATTSLRSPVMAAAAGRALSATAEGLIQAAAVATDKMRAAPERVTNPGTEAYLQLRPDPRRPAASA